MCAYVYVRMHTYICACYDHSTQNSYIRVFLVVVCVYCSTDAKSGAGERSFSIGEKNLIYMKMDAYLTLIVIIANF